MISMRQRADWVTHFELTESQLAEWRQRAHHGEDALDVALREGGIDQGVYLHWAAAHYELPYVSPSFFERGLTDDERSLWKDVSREAVWSAKLQPLRIWDGVLIVGCSAPPDDAQISRPHRVVLAPAAQLVDRWAALHPETEVAAATAAIEAAPALIENEEKLAPDGFQLGPEFFASAPESPGELDGFATLNAPADETESPEGMSLVGGDDDGDAPAGLSFELSEPSAEAPHSQEDNEATSPSIALGGLTFDFGAPAKTEPASEANAGVAAPAAPAAMVEPPIEPPAPPPLQQTKFNQPPPSRNGSPFTKQAFRSEGTRSGAFAKSGAPTPPPTPPPAPRPAKVAETPAPRLAPETPPQAEIVAAPTIAAIAPPEAAPSADQDDSKNAFPKRDAMPADEGAEAFPMELTHTGISVAGKALAGGKAELRFESCQSYEEVAETAFRGVVPPYQRAMMLVFQGGQLKPWKWTPEFSPKKERPDSIDLDKPSVFRIVYNTLLPYHGRVVTNDVNAKFFDQADGGRVPQHLTLVPVVVDRQIAAMLMAAADGEVNYRSSLALAERIGEQMSAAIKRIRSSKAAA